MVKKAAASSSSSSSESSSDEAPVKVVKSPVKTATTPKQPEKAPAKQAEKSTPKALPPKPAAPKAVPANKFPKRPASSSSDSDSDSPSPVKKRANSNSSVTIAKPPVKETPVINSTAPDVNEKKNRVPAAVKIASGDSMLDAKHAAIALIHARANQIESLAAEIVAIARNFDYDRS